MKKFFKCVLFGTLAVALAAGFTGCYGEDIDNLQQDVAAIKAGISEDVTALNNEISRLQSLIDVLDQAIINQNGRIADLERDLDLDNPNSAISLAIEQGNMATLNAAKIYADSLHNALNSQMTTIKNFLGLNTSGQLVVNEAAPNNMLNGTYATLNDFVRTLTVYLSTMKGWIDANTSNITALQTSVSEINTKLGTPDAFWAGLNVNTVWQGIGYNYASILAILNRLNNLGGVNGRTLESFVTDVDAFIASMTTFQTEINARFAGFTPGETIVQMIEKYVGDLIANDGEDYDDATEMINGEISKLDTKLSTDINNKIDSLRTEVMTYVDTKIAALKAELLGVMQDMVTGLMIVTGNDNDNSVVYDANIGFPVIRELEDFTFGPGGEIVFVEGNIVLSADPEPQPILVKVTPDHVDISAATFVLFDSEKKDYLADGTFTKTVVRYTGGLLTRAVTETGLWVITLELTDISGFPEGVLLSLGIVNNMAEAPSADRIVSTGNIIDASTSVEPYDPVYYMSGNTAYPVYSVSQMGTPELIDAVSNSGANDVWTTAPSVDLTTGVYTPGTPGPDDDRSNITMIVHNLSDTYAGLDVGLTGAYDELRAWYVEFKSQMPDATSESDWGGELNQLKSNDISATVNINIPLFKALHREVVEFNVQGVNIDATLVDPDGVPFTVGMVADSYTETNVSEFTVELDDDYAPGDWNEFFDTEGIPFDITALGFTPAFNSGLVASYSIELESGYFIDLDGGIRTDNPDWNAYAPDGTQFTNQFLGVMEANVGGTWTEVDGVNVIDWDAVTEIRFAGVDPKAMMPGEIYDGTLILTEDWNSTVSSMTNYVPGTGTYANITLEFPITITLGEDLPFDLDMMNYKPNMGAGNNLIVWPVASGSSATHDFDTSFDYTPASVSNGVVFSTTAPGFTMTGHTTTVPNIVSHLSQPNVPINTVYTAHYTYGPVWENAYGDGNFMALWENNNNGEFTVEFRNRMDWVNSVDADLTYALATIPTTISGSVFVFTPMPNSGLGASTFTLAQAIAQGWVADPTGQTIETTVSGSSNPSDVDKYFTLAFNADGSVTVTTVGGASITPGESVTLDLTFTIKDQFGSQHTYTHTMTING